MDRFYDLVARMRRMQNAYFKTKEQHYLIASKEAERQVDEELNRQGLPTMSKQERDEQQRLF